VPPAGFEPALTAPESVSPYGSDLPKRALICPARARIGRNPFGRGRRACRMGTTFKGVRTRQCGRDRGGRYPGGRRGRASAGQRSTLWPAPGTAGPVPDPDRHHTDQVIIASSLIIGCLAHRQQPLPHRLAHSINLIFSRLVATMAPSRRWPAARPGVRVAGCRGWRESMLLSRQPQQDQQCGQPGTSPVDELGRYVPRS